MMTRTKAVVAAVAATALAVGTAGVVVAAAGDGAGSSTAAGATVSTGANAGPPQAGMGMGLGQGRLGQRPQGLQPGMLGDDGMSVSTESGVLTVQQRIDLAELAQEEKLAHDLYVSFGALFDDQRFDNISAAESQHLSAVRSMLTGYDVVDPTVGMAEGEFSSTKWQDRYDQLLAKGSESLAMALDVGAAVERMDIADLQSAITGLDAPDVEQVYSHLLRGSQMHLQAFTR